MFSHEGPARTARSNGILAGYLAFVAGFTNSAGLALLGTFTSHVTGSVGRVSAGLAQGQSAAARGAAALVALFLCGAVVASLLVESNRFKRTSSGYGAALLVQGALLGAFIFTGAGGLLSFSMGMQNSLVTRLSGSVVRTTHLTGVVTDLGIELPAGCAGRRRASAPGRPGRDATQPRVRRRSDRCCWSRSPSPSRAAAWPGRSRRHPGAPGRSRSRRRRSWPRRPMRSPPACGSRPPEGRFQPPPCGPITRRASRIFSFGAVRPIWEAGGSRCHGDQSLRAVKARRGTRSRTCSGDHAPCAAT